MRDNKKSMVEVIQRETPVSKPDTKPQKKRVAAYCRVSTDLEEQQSSLQIQMSAFQEQIDARPDWELAGIYADNGISGTKVQNRTEFLRMMHDCDNGLIDYIITKSISRFARNTLECLSYVRRLKEIGVFVYFEKERLDTSSGTSEMLLSILAAFAQEESRNTSENVKWGMRKRFSEGIPKWSAVYGYTKVGEIEYIIDEERAKVVRRIFDEYVKGKPLTEIGRGLAKDNILSPLGKSWCPAVLSRMLRNEKYCGDVLMQKTYTVDHLTHKRKDNDKTVVPSYYIRDHHKPIVGRKAYEMVQIILSLKDKHKGATQYPYYGRLFCPVCGSVMIRSCVQENGHPVVWMCSQENSEINCESYYLKEKYIDEAFKEAYTKLDMQAVVKQSKNKNSSLAKSASDVMNLKMEMATIESVEYYLLDALVEKISFLNWDTMVIEWNFGLKSKIKINYLAKRDIPRHKEQLKTAAIKSLSRIENRDIGKSFYNSHKRPVVIAYDSTMKPIEEE